MAAIQEGPGGRGERIIRTSYPVVKGLILGTTKISDVNPYLIPTTKSLLSWKDRVGL